MISPVPTERFMQNLTCIDFQNCFITWETIKRTISKTPNAQKLGLSRCRFSERKTIPPLNEFEEYQVGMRISNLKASKIIEYGQDLKPINKLLEKLIGFNSRNLQSLQISFDPQNIFHRGPKIPVEEIATDKVETKNIEIFCNLVLKLIKYNGPVLKRLSLDIKHDKLLSVILPSIIAGINGIF
jgi:hypothetical protein